MIDLSYLDPRIDVAANSPRLEMIVSRLKAAGLRPFPATAPVSFDSADPLLIDVESVDRGTLERCARAQEMGLSRPIIILSGPGAGVALSDCIVVARDSDLVHLRPRLVSLARRDARMAEFRIRKETAVQFGLKTTVADPDIRPEVLYLGDGCANFLALQAALRTEGVAMTAALTLGTAEDYLDSGRFSAILVDPNAAISGGFETLPSGAPVFVLRGRGEEAASIGASVFAQGTDEIECDGGSERAAARISAAIRRHIAMAPIMPRPSLGAMTIDSMTGFFRQSFLEAHLARQMAVSAEREEPLSMLTLRFERCDASSWKAVCDLVRRRLRDTDCPAVLSQGVLGISMPTTPFRGAARLAERIAAAVANDPALSDVLPSWRVVEKRAYHTAQTLLGAGQSGPFMRASAA